MSRLWLGIVLLIFLLMLGFGTGSFMDATTARISHKLESAAEIALTEDLQAAAALAEDARKTWDDGWRWVATMADHAPMDEIDGLFAQLVIYADSGAIEEFSGYCRRISKLVLAVGEAHSFSWWNLL